ncbi:Ferroptosis suppressor protein 1 [Vulpes lagopus]
MAYHAGLHASIAVANIVNSRKQRPLKAYKPAGRPCDSLHLEAELGGRQVGCPTGGLTQDSLPVDQGQPGSPSGNRTCCHPRGAGHSVLSDLGA